MATIIIEEQLEIPDGIHCLEDFRRWARSDEFPEQGRISYLNGRIEVDMSPEDLYSHSSLKTEVVIAVGQFIKFNKMGDVFTDRTRISSPEAILSCEPDVLFLSYESQKAGRVRLVPKSNKRPGRYVEIEGPPDLIVEVVSDSSVKKDTQTLPKLYFAAGVPEFWLADARGDELFFQIHTRGEQGFVAQSIDAAGFQRSAILNRRFKLIRGLDELSHWQYDLVHEA